MDKMVDSLNDAYQDFISAATNVLEAKGNPSDLKTTTRDTSLEDFKKKWELFKVSCDQADEFVNSVKQRVVSECQVNEVIRRVAPGQATITGSINSALFNFPTPLRPGYLNILLSSILM